ncbi:MAG TPA: PQQ-dependent sugar dehydrogenase [Candidatus Binatia bacterium]|nr:PQQ-dependent sugar dehydrogenase [Candidatus Binatia bacterium]
MAVFCATVLALGFLSTAALAHPPWNPFDDTRFAPITRFGPAVGVEVVASGLTAPLKAVPAPGLPDWLFVVDQVGKLWAVNLTTGAKSVFLDVSARLVTLGVCGPNTFDERGLLGVAFHPDFRENGLFYTYTSEPTNGPPTIPSPTVPTAAADHQNVIAEWRAANPANPTAGVVPGSRRELMRVDWPQFNHDGGDLGFGPDGKLYISMGDGGGADDADGQPFITAPPRYTPCGSMPIFGHQGNGNGQRLNTPLGKILRIDVNPPFTPGKAYRVPADNPFVATPGAVPEIWAYGFRNPFRFSFDSKTGELYVGDVGQNDIEEVSIVTRGGNFGWNCKEGTLFFHIAGSVPDDGFASQEPDPGRPECSPRRTRFIDPVAQYDTHHEGHSVIGGFVYHGRAIPRLRGHYVFADFSLLFKFPRGPHDYGRLLAFHPGGGRGLRKISELLVLPGGAVSLAILGMGIDARSELYVMGNVSGVPFDDPNPNPSQPPIPNGRVLRIVPAPEADED